MIKIANSKQFKKDLNLIFDKIINYHWSMYKRRVANSQKNNLSISPEWKEYHHYISIIKNTKKDKIKKLFSYISCHPVLNEIIYDEDKCDGVYLRTLNNLADNFPDSSPFNFGVTNKDGVALCNICSTPKLFNPNNFFDFNDIYLELFRFNNRFFLNRSKLSVIKFSHKYMDSIHKDISIIAPVLKNIDQLFYFNKRPSKSFKTKRYKTLEDLKLSPIYVDRSSPFKGFNNINKNTKDDYYIDPNDIYYPFIKNNYDLFLQDINIKNLDELSSLFKYARIIQKYLNRYNISAYSRFFKLSNEEGLFTGIYNVNDNSDYYFYIKIDTSNNLNDLKQLNLYSYSMVDKNSTSPLPYYSNDSILKTEYTLEDYINNYEDVIAMESLAEY